MITSFDINIINFLLNYCKLHKIPNKFTLSSCLVYNNKKYGLSVNDYNKANLLTKKIKSTSCSEVNTIYKSSKVLNVTKFRSSTIYVTGLGKSANCNLLKSSKPCKYCYNIITNFNCGRLVYLTSKDNKQLIINEEILNAKSN